MGPYNPTGGEPSSDGTVEVLLVAVHNDELSLLQKVVADAELSASFYEIEIFSTIRAVVDEPVKPVMVLTSAQPLRRCMSSGAASWRSRTP